MPIHEVSQKFGKSQYLIKLVCVCFLSMHCYSIETQRHDQSPAEDPQLFMLGWQTVVTQNGQKRVQVRADSLLRKRAQGTARFGGTVEVVFFAANGDTASVLSADHGTVDPDGRQIAVTGDVVVLSNDGTRLETDSLRWDREQERIFGDGIVSIFRPEGRERGVGFEASADLKQWTLKQVQTRVVGSSK